MNNNYNKYISYVAVGVLMALSFIASFYTLQNRYNPTLTNTKEDLLSGEEYVPVDPGMNPYVPYFVGFDELSNRGVSTDDLNYIYDVLTNFTVYNTHTYKAKVSYVSDSFERKYTKSISTTYTFKFGINDTTIYSLTAVSNPSARTIHITIYKDDGKVFDRNFNMYISSL